MSSKKVRFSPEFKEQLVLAFLEAARVPAQRGRSEHALSTPELVRAAQSGLWRIDASHLQ